MPGYVIDGWKLDGVAQPAGPLSVPITAEGAAAQRGADGEVVCHELTVQRGVRSTAYPLRTARVSPASRGLYAQGTNVTVTAGETAATCSKGGTRPQRLQPHAGQDGQGRDAHRELPGQDGRREIQETVIDPALNALGVAAKKAVGGIAYITKIFAEHVIEDVFLKTLSSIGSGLKSGFDAIGVEGAVLDGIVLGLQTPSNAFERHPGRLRLRRGVGLGRSVPTLEDVKDTVTSAAKGEAKSQVRGVEVDEVMDEARAP